MSLMFLTKVLSYFLITQLAVNEVCSYRIPRVGNGHQVKPASYLKGMKDQPKVYDTKYSISTLPRPISLDLFVVVDPTAYRYHGNDTEHYAMEMLNVAASIWKSTSLNVAVVIRVAKLLILKENQDDLEITNHANLSLRNFCHWQMSHYVTDDAGGFHYDAAFLITRTDIQIGGNYDATGIAYTGGVCDHRVKCALCEDRSPMILSHTIAHEIGHLLGMLHDGDRNSCPDRVNIMSGYVTRGFNTFLWSQCSRQALLEFLNSTQGKCLDHPHANTKEQVVALDTVAMPGRYYDADYQCQMLYGPMATSCSNWSGPKRCIMLKCRVQWDTSDCATDGRPAIQGTSCGPLDWCFKGYCIKRSRKGSIDSSARLGESYRQKNRPTSGLQCRECNTFPYMDTPAPTTLPIHHGPIV